MEEQVFDSVVFVDIDGVLLTNFSDYSGKYVNFEKGAIEFFNKLYDIKPYDIIISSSWRHAYSFKYLHKKAKSPLL